MPLKSGRSARVRDQNIEEMLASSTFAPDKPAKKRREMATAAAYRKAREYGLRRGSH